MAGSVSGEAGEARRRTFGLSRFEASVPRASRILQALLVAFDRRGFAVRVTEKNETFVTVLGEAFKIALVERLKKVTVNHTYGTGVDLEPSGRLMLRIGSSYHNAGVSDSTSRRIEHSLNRFVVNLVRRALEAKRERALHAERPERWVIQDEKNRLAQQQRDSEALRRRRLRTAAVRWGKYTTRPTHGTTDSTSCRTITGGSQRRTCSFDLWDN